MKRGATDESGWGWKGRERTLRVHVLTRLYPATLGPENGSSVCMELVYIMSVLVRFISSMH